MTIVYDQPQPTKEQQKAYDKAKRKRKIIRVLKETAGTMSGAGDQGKTRRAQFAGYMTMIDELQNVKSTLRRGRVELGNLEARSGKIGSARTTKMTDIMDKYHDKALRMAQAKYYQKQLG